MLLEIIHNINFVSSHLITTIGVIGIFALRKLFETHQECMIDEDCIFYPKCCLDHCCDYGEYKTRIIPIYVNNK